MSNSNNPRLFAVSQPSAKPTSATVEPEKFYLEQLEKYEQKFVDAALGKSSVEPKAVMFAMGQAMKGHLEASMAYRTAYGVNTSYLNEKYPQFFEPSFDPEKPQEEKEFKNNNKANTSEWYLAELQNIETQYTKNVTRCKTLYFKIGSVKKVNDGEAMNIWFAQVLPLRDGLPKLIKQHADYVKKLKSEFKVSYPEITFEKLEDPVKESLKEGQGRCSIM